MVIMHYSLWLELFPKNVLFIQCTFIMRYIYSLHRKCYQSFFVCGGLWAARALPELTVREAMRFIRTRAHPCSGESSGSDRWRGYLLQLPNQCDTTRLFGRGVPLSSRLSSPCLLLIAIFLRIQRIMEALATRCALFLAQIALFSNTGM